MGYEGSLALYVHSQMLDALNACVGFKEGAHAELMVSFKEIDRFSLSRHGLERIHHTPVPRVNISFVSMIELKKIAENKNHVRIGANIAKEGLYKPGLSLFLLFEVRIPKKHHFHELSAEIVLECFLPRPHPMACINKKLLAVENRVAGSLGFTVEILGGDGS